MSELTRLRGLVSLMKRQASQVAYLEDELAHMKTALRRTQEEDLPELMREVGMTSLTDDDGDSVALVEDVQTAITEATKSAALAWLHSNGFSGIVKTVVDCSFGKGETEKAAEAASILVANGFAAHVGESVHAGTLKAFVKERMREGDPVPMDIFNVRPFSRATIKKGK